MVSIKDLVQSDKEVREIGNNMMKVLVKELAMDDSSDEYKRWVCDKIYESQMIRDKWEEVTSNSWFRLGKLKGMFIGMFLGAACFAGGQFIGANIKSKIES